MCVHNDKDYLNHFFFPFLFYSRCKTQSSLPQPWIFFFLRFLPQPCLPNSDHLFLHSPPTSPVLFSLYFFFFSFFFSFKLACWGVGCGFKSICWVLWVKSTCGLWLVVASCGLWCVGCGLWWVLWMTIVDVGGLLRWVCGGDNFFLIWVVVGWLWLQQWVVGGYNWVGCADGGGQVWCWWVCVWLI